MNPPLFCHLWTQRVNWASLEHFTLDGAYQNLFCLKFLHLQLTAPSCLPRSQTYRSHPRRTTKRWVAQKCLRVSFRWPLVSWLATLPTYDNESSEDLRSLPWFHSELFLKSAEFQQPLRLWANYVLRCTLWSACALECNSCVWSATSDLWTMAARASSFSTCKLDCRAPAASPCVGPDQHKWPASATSASTRHSWARFKVWSHPYQSLCPSSQVSATTSQTVFTSRQALDVSVSFFSCGQYRGSASFQVSLLFTSLDSRVWSWCALIPNKSLFGSYPGPLAAKRDAPL